MEHVDKVVYQFDQLAKGMPAFEAQCKKHNLRPGHVLGAASALLLVLLVLFKGYDVVCAMLTCVYPMLASIRSIESKNDEENKKWLCFWTIFGLFQTVELFFGFLLAFIPFYNWLRLAFFVFMMAPQTNGAYTLYVSVVGPFLKTHEKEIKSFIEKAKSGAANAATAARQEATKQANEHLTADNMMKMAAKANEVKESMSEVTNEKME